MTKPNSQSVIKVISLSSGYYSHISDDIVLLAHTEQQRRHDASSATTEGVCIHNCDNAIRQSLLAGYYNDNGAVVWDDLVHKKDGDSGSSCSETVSMSESLLSIDVSENEPQLDALPSTRLCAHTRAFQESLVLLQGEPNDSSNEINTARLLQACWKFYDLLRDIGNAQIATDFRNNIHKVEAVYQSVPDHSRKTVADLLAHEKATGCHGRRDGVIAGHQLKDPSAAMGLLWMRRNIALQCQTYSLVIEQDMDPVEAALDAYRSELERFFGWVERKAFLVGLKILTPKSRDHMLARLGGFKTSAFTDAQEAAIKKDLRHLLSVWRHLIAAWRGIFLQLGLEEPEG